MSKENKEFIIKRTPEELYQFCLRYKNQISENNFEAGLLRAQQDYKFFIDELCPLSLFCNEVFDEEHQIEPIRGNQGFDAKVYKMGHFITNIEVAYPHEGSKRATKARNLITTGASNGSLSSPSNLDEIRPYIIAVCEAKSRKDYSDCILLFHIATGAFFEE